jgi:hypothetical protein
MVLRVEVKGDDLQSALDDRRCIGCQQNASGTGCAVTLVVGG